MEMADRIRLNAEKQQRVNLANRRMIAKLLELSENGKIWNEYDVGFIERVNDLLNADKQLSEKQQEHLDEIFHNRY